MELLDKVVVITGAAGGIGAACAHRFAREAPRRIVCADLDAGAAARVAAQVNGEVGRDVAYGRRCDVGVEASVRALTDDDVWNRAWRVNPMAHVWAARHLLPGWLARARATW